MSKPEQSTYGIYEEDAKAIFAQTVIEEATLTKADKGSTEDFKADIRDSMGWSEERTEAVYDQIVDDSRAVYNNFGTEKCYKHQVDNLSKLLVGVNSGLQEKLSELDEEKKRLDTHEVLVNTMSEFTNQMSELFTNKPANNKASK